MSRPKPNMIGYKHPKGRLTVVQEAGRNKHGNLMCVCRCDCGAEKTIGWCEVKTGNTKSCGCLRKDEGLRRRGKGHPLYKNGKNHRSDGYVRLSGQYDHPNAGKNGLLLEHIKVMTNKLGRPLFPGETVHHKNGIRHDNRPSNLELRFGGHGKGQRVEDLVTWAKEILQRYEA